MNRYWLTLIENYHMLVPGTRKNKRDAERDLATKEYLREQVSPDTFKDRKRFYEALKDASCCADHFEQYCDECSNRNIQFKSVPTFELDADVRRYITKYWRYQTTSELKAEFNEKGESHVRKPKTRRKRTTILSGVRDRKSNYDPVWVRGQERVGLSGEPEEVSSDQAERVEAMLSHPLGEEMVT